MKEEVAQMVALACHGNAFLQGRKTDQLFPFFPYNESCYTCASVKFSSYYKSRNGRWKTEEIAATPNEWFNYLKKEGSKGIRINWTPSNNDGVSDRMLSGFVGGGVIWEMLVPRKANSFQVWRSRWKSNKKSDGWEVEYLTPKDAPVSISIREEKNLKKVYDNLVLALKKILKFSEIIKADGFGKTFKQALEALDSKQSSIFNLIPDNLVNDENLAMIYTCKIADVFGGMGSWNDMYFEDEQQEEYENLSEELFTAMNNAILFATNSTFKDH